jgi:hypothetical protein
MFFDRQGHRVSRQTWLLLSAKPGYCTIADDTVVSPTGACHDVQTFWIGVGDAQHRMIFCTVVTRERSTPAIWGWRTDHAARDGHHKICAWLIGNAVEPAGWRHWST